MFGISEGRLWRWVNYPVKPFSKIHIDKSTDTDACKIQVLINEKNRSENNIYILPINVK